MLLMASLVELLIERQAQEVLIEVTEEALNKPPPVEELSGHHLQNFLT
jgi:hypothetical protein